MKITGFNFLITLLFFVLPQLAPETTYAQQDSSKKVIYEFADKLPFFKGDYIAYLAENVNYPKEAINNNIQGTVYAIVVIDTVGKICEVVIKKDIGSGCGKEVERVFFEMPNWEPAKQNGKPVNFRMTVPVKFVLQNDTKKKKKRRSEEE